MTFMLGIIATIILIEAITGIISKSELFRPLREFLFDRRENKLFGFMHRIIDCPYCLSVWVGMFCGGVLYLYINNLLPFIIMWIFISLIFHRLSNVLHYIIDRIDSNHESLDKDT